MESTTLNGAEQADYAEFVARVRRRTGIDLNLYRQPQMCRRLKALVEQAKLETFTAYAERMERDPVVLSTFLDRLTINVSELFRNPEMWKNLEERLLPQLLAGGRPLKVWSAGCSFGAEAYTLAMILASLAALGDADVARRHTLIATDIDATILARAKKGVYHEAEIRSVPEPMRRKYLVKQDGGDFEVARELRDRVTFRKHDLLRDAFEEGFDLIVCRNVVIYFTDNAKDELFRRFTAALRPGGVLFVGGTERIHQYRELGLTTPLPFFYRKPEKSGRNDAAVNRGGARAAA